MNPDQIESLPDTAPHRLVDLEIVNADRSGAYLLSSASRKTLTVDGVVTKVMSDRTSFYLVLSGALLAIRLSKRGFKILSPNKFQD